MLGFEKKKHEEVVYSENIQNIKTNFIVETETYSNLIQTRVESFSEKDTVEFKSFLSSFLEQNRKAIDEFFLKKYLAKSQSFDIQVKRRIF